MSRQSPSERGLGARLCGLAPLVLALNGCTENTVSVNILDETYAWQRVWTPAVVDAVQGDAGDRTVVLAAEVEERGTIWTGLWTETGQPVADLPMDWTPTARALPNPVGLALRWSDVDQAMNTTQAKELATLVLDRAAAAGLTVGTLHLDADIPTARLAAWATVVDELAEAVEPVDVLALTLVDHIDRPGWAALGAAADGLVLQVHSVPTMGAAGPTLLDVAQAKRHLQRALDTDVGPITLALPTHTLHERQTGRAVRADPADVAPWVAALQASPPKGLAGIIWFRLPVAGDPSTWTADTFAAVRRGALPSTPEAPVVVQLGAPPPAWGAHPSALLLSLQVVGPAQVPRPVLTLDAESPMVCAALDHTWQVRPTDASARHWRATPVSSMLLAPGAPVPALLVTATGPVDAKVVAADGG